MDFFSLDFCFSRIKHYPSFSLLRPMFDSSYGGLYSWQLPANWIFVFPLAIYPHSEEKSTKNHISKKTEEETDFKLIIRFHGIF